MRTNLFTTCAVLLSASQLRAQDAVAVFEGPAAGVGSVTLFDAATGAELASPAELAGLAWLPFDFAGRTQLHEFSPTRPRRFTDVAGASRLRLQANHGSLYHFVRPGSGPQSSYGFLIVPEVGPPRILIERSGIGGGGRNPFLSHVGVAPDGAAILVGTHGEGGGDLLEIATSGPPSIIDRTSNSAPARIYPWSLALGLTTGFAVTNFGVLRFDRAGTGDAAFVTYGADTPPSWFSGSLMTSNDASHVVFSAGTAFDQQHVYSAGPVGDARRATLTAGPVSGAGSENEGASGPWLAVSDDGVWCAWRTTIATSHECMVARSDVAPLPAQQLSSNANFTDTLDEVALFAFRGPSRLLFAVGEQNPGAPPGKVDLFSANLVPGQPAQFQNLTLTSGQTVTPFTAIPSLEPARAALLPDQSGILIHDDSGQIGDLFAWRDGQPGLQLVMSGVKELNELEFGGPGAVFVVRKDNNLREMYRADSGFLGAPTLVASSINGTTFDRMLARADGWAAFLENGTAGDRLGRVQSTSGTLDVLPGGAALFGPAFGWSAGGSLVFTRIQNGTFAHVAWQVGAPPVRFVSAGSSGQILPSF